MDVAIVLNSPNMERTIEESIIIAADAGYKIALNQNRKILLAIGDFDSSEVPENIPVIKLNQEKDDTDGQACLEYAIKKGYKNISIYGICGGRLDHQLCNLSLLVSGEQQGRSIVGHDDGVDIYYKEAGTYSFKVGKGNTFSTIGFCNGTVITDGKGIKYPIQDLSLEPDSLGVGISNIAEEDEISFKVISGGVLVFIYLK